MILNKKYRFMSVGTANWKHSVLKLKSAAGETKFIGELKDAVPGDMEVVDDENDVIPNATVASFVGGRFVRYGGQLFVFPATLGQSGHAFTVTLVCLTISMR